MYKICYGICFTPQTYNSYINHWTGLKSNRENVYIILDNTKNEQINYESHIFTEEIIRNKFNFKENVNKNHFWNSQGDKNIVWFYAHLRMMDFYLSNPDYDFYWFFDDDVSCNNWDLFLNGFKNDTSDFLSYFLFKNINVEDYLNIPKVDNKMYSGELWFNRYPGNGDKLKIDDGKYFGSFFPIVRFSKRAMIELVNQTKEGFSGYGEGFVPTTLSKLNYSMNTIFNNDNTSRYFDVNLVDIKHKNQKINWEWL